VSDNAGIVPPAETITLAEAAEILGVSRGTALIWYHRGWLPGYQLGQRTSPIRLYRDKVLAFLKARQQAARASRPGQGE
jgi:excisionase family DNA binding protein